MAKFRVKPRPVSAQQWNGDYDRMCEFADPTRNGGFPCDADGKPVALAVGVLLTGTGTLAVLGLRGTMIAQRGDWVVKKPNNDLSVVSEAQFPSSFEAEPAPMDRDTAASIARAAAVTHDIPLPPGSLGTAPPWTPPEWAVDAIIEAHRRGASIGG